MDKKILNLKKLSIGALKNAVNWGKMISMIIWKNLLLLVAMGIKYIAKHPKILRYPIVFSLLWFVVIPLIFYCPAKIAFVILICVITKCVVSKLP